MNECLMGSLGSGKSAVATARAIAHLQDGGVVAANFSLCDGFSDIIARRNPWTWFDDQFRYNKSKSIFNRFFRVESLSAISKINPRELATGLHATTGKYQEGQGLLILDECALIFNSRTWDKNQDWVKFFTQARKLGWNVVLISHDVEMIDRQIRPTIGYVSTFRNLQQIKIPVTGIPLSPFPLFLVIQKYAGLGAGSGAISDRKIFPLPYWAANLYDSLLVFDAKDWGKQSEPQPCGKPPEPPCGLGGKTKMYPIRKSQLTGIYFDDYLSSVRFPIEPKMPALACEAQSGALRL